MAVRMKDVYGAELSVSHLLTEERGGSGIKNNFWATE